MYILYHKVKSTNNFSLALPGLIVNDAKIKRDYLLKFLGVKIDTRLTWKTHVSWEQIVLEFYLKESAKFSGSGVNVDLARSRTIVQSCVYGYFVDPILFYVCILFVQDFFL